MLLPTWIDLTSHILPTNDGRFTYDKATIWSVSFILLIGLRVNASTFWYVAEKFGPRKMITIALVWWSAFTIFTGMIKHHGLLYLVRFLFGIGEANVSIKRCV